jgi:hypothetical protein
MKICSSCKQSFPGGMFYRDFSKKDGLHHQCKTCATKRRAENGYKRRPPVDQARDKARIMARDALAKGLLVREPCFMCGAEAEMHHPAYSSPLLVTWLCRPHHLQVHRELPPASRSILAVNMATGERKVLPSMSAGLDHGFKPRSISLACNGHQRSHQGWFFSFIEQVGD